MLDDDNLRSALKAVRDGVADALGIEDNDPRIHFDYDQDGAANAGIIIHISIEDMPNGMLVIERLNDQRIVIGHDIEICLVRAQSGKARIGIIAPRSVRIDRKELLEQEVK